MTASLDDDVGSPQRGPADQRRATDRASAMLPGALWCSACWSASPRWLVLLVIVLGRPRPSRLGLRDVVPVLPVRAGPGSSRRWSAPSMMMLVRAVHASRSASAPRSTSRSTPISSAGTTGDRAEHPEPGRGARRSSTAFSALAFVVRGPIGLGRALLAGALTLRCSSCRSSSSPRARRSVPCPPRSGRARWRSAPRAGR